MHEIPFNFESKRHKIVAVGALSSGANSIQPRIESRKAAKPFNRLKAHTEDLPKVEFPGGPQHQRGGEGLQVTHLHGDNDSSARDERATENDHVAMSAAPACAMTYRRHMLGSSGVLLISR